MQESDVLQCLLDDEETRSTHRWSVATPDARKMSGARDALLMCRGRDIHGIMRIEYSLATGMTDEEREQAYWIAYTEQLDEIFAVANAARILLRQTVIRKQRVDREIEPIVTAAHFEKAAAVLETAIA